MVKASGRLPEEEAAVLRLLEKRLAKAKEPLSKKLKASIRHVARMKRAHVAGSGLRP
jgi:hypothetical protein